MYTETYLRFVPAAAEKPEPKLVDAELLLLVLVLKPPLLAADAAPDVPFGVSSNRAATFSIASLDTCKGLLLAVLKPTAAAYATCHKYATPHKCQISFARFEDANDVDTHGMHVL